MLCDVEEAPDPGCESNDSSIICVLNYESPYVGSMSAAGHAEPIQRFEALLGSSPLLKHSIAGTCGTC